jgi:DNA polymerase III epsilon subunit-like protein
VGGEFYAFVSPSNPIQPIITELTGIANDDVMDAGDFTEVGGQFVAFLLDKIDEFCETHYIRHVGLTAYNGRRFEIPFKDGTHCLVDGECLSWTLPACPACHQEVQAKPPP